MQVVFMADGLGLAEALWDAAALYGVNGTGGHQENTVSQQADHLKVCDVAFEEPASRAGSRVLCSSW